MPSIIKEVRRVQLQELLKSIESELTLRTKGLKIDAIYAKIAQLILRARFGKYDCLGHTGTDQIAKEIFDAAILNRINNFTEGVGSPDVPLEYDYLFRQVFNFCTDVVFSGVDDPYK